MKVLGQLNFLKTVAASLLLSASVNLLAEPALAERHLLAMGLVPHVTGPMRAGRFSAVYVSRRSSAAGRRTKYAMHNFHGSWSARQVHRGFTSLKKLPQAAKTAAPPVKFKAQQVAPALNLNAAASTRVLGPGAVYKVYAGRTRINLVDVDMASPLQIRPITAASNFRGLKDTLDHSRDSGALAAINANYFKPNGVPLGTLMLDGEWFSGPLYDRVALGFTDSGYARIARVSLHGVLHTSNPEHASLWINNVNSPRRTGSRCILYTRRWGESVSLPYPGTLIAVSAAGEVIDRAEKSLAIPYGGFVLADSRESPAASLSRGDVVKVDWKISPAGWQNVTQAVSGGPLLLKDGKFAFDLAAEKFPSAWTGSQITRRTACGITHDDHLLLATFEGPHTLYDVAKFFLNHGCTEAMNLDGGGSTTMVVKGTTVTRNASDSQRRVAVALGLFSADKAKNLAGCNGCGFSPRSGVDLAGLLPVADPLATMIMGNSDPLRDLYNEPASAEMALRLQLPSPAPGLPLPSGEGVENVEKAEGVPSPGINSSSVMNVDVEAQLGTAGAAATSDNLSTEIK